MCVCACVCVCVCVYVCVCDLGHLSSYEVLHEAVKAMEVVSTLPQTPLLHAPFYYLQTTVVLLENSGLVKCV